MDKKINSNIGLYYHNGMLLRKPISNVTLFSGKDYDFRAQIMYYLATHEASTTWDISLFVSEDEIREQPSHRSRIAKTHSAGILRNIKERMIPQKYVRQIGTKISKGNPIPTYGLSFRGSLIVLSLDLTNDEIKTILKINSDVNPFYKLILSLEKKDVKYDLCNKIILQGLINGIKNNVINLSCENESIIGQSIIPALFLHFLTINKSDLKKLNKHIKKILDIKNSEGIQVLLTQFVSRITNPILWKSWSDDEIAQMNTLNIIISETLDYSSK